MLLATAAILAATALPPPDRRDPVCDGRPDVTYTPAEEFESAVLGLQYDRRDMGMPSSRAHIVALLRSKAARERSRRLDAGLNGPVTVAEARYLRARANLNRDDRGAKYLDRHERAINAGATVVDDWPRMPYLAFYVSRDVERVRAALAERIGSSYRFTVRRARRSTRELERVQDRIASKTLAKLGIAFLQSTPDERAGVLRVEVVSARPDAAAVMRRRYGRLLRVKVRPPRPDDEICIGLRSYAASADGLRLTVRYGHASWQRFGRTVVTETAEAVIVGVIKLSPHYGGPMLDLRIEAAEIALAAPLGARRVLDAESGEPVELSEPSGSS